jgi:hypothetical protein
MPQPATDEPPLDPRITRQRRVQLRRARATIELLIDEVGAHNAVVLLNDGLREALDRLDGEAC